MRTGHYETDQRGPAPMAHPQQSSDTPKELPMSMTTAPSTPSTTTYELAVKAGDVAGKAIEQAEFVAEKVAVLATEAARDLAVRAGEVAVRAGEVAHSLGDT